MDTTKGLLLELSKKKTGLFERADGGTLFLDEIHTLSLSLQNKLLKPIEEKTIRPVGSSQEISLNNLRIITGTNESIEQLIKNQTFKADLHFRLCGAVITFPPLNNRKNDIPLFVRKFTQNKKKEIRLTPCAWEALHEYHWPGNVRQLLNILEQAVILSSGMINGDLIHDTINSKLREREVPSSLPKCYQDILENLGYKQLKKEIELAIYRYLKVEKGLGVNEIQRSYGIYNSSLTRMKDAYYDREFYRQ